MILVNFFLKYCKDDNTPFISCRLASTVIVAPILITLIVGLIVLIPFSRDFGYWLLKENKPIEILTFIFFITGGVYGLLNTMRYSKLLSNTLIFYYCIYSIFLVFIAMEEIAWGQWFFSFSTPDAWLSYNVQGETTLHNIKEIQGFNDVYCLIYGIGGIVGVFLSYNTRFSAISAPKILLPFFIIIFIHSLVDVTIDFTSINPNIRRVIRKFTELIELLIATSAFIYLWIKFKQIASR